MSRSLILFCFFLTAFLSSCEDEPVIDDPIDIEELDTFCPANSDVEYPEVRPEGTFCTTEVCDEYLAIWKELLQEHNNFNQDFLDDHIRIHSTSLNDWAQGLSYRVCYDYKLDWAIAFTCDSYIIKIDPDSDIFLSLNLPKDQYLEKEEIKIAIDKRAFGSNMTIINPITQLKYESIEQAMNDLILYADIKLLCFYGIDLDRYNGNLIVKAGAQYFDKENSCIEGTSDLITGERVTKDQPCSI